MTLFSSLIKQTFDHMKNLSIHPSPSTRIQILILAVLPLLFTTACGSLNLLTPATPTFTAPPISPAAIQPTPIPEAEITFRVQVPADTPPEDLVMLTFLDEVTGLAINSEHYPMDSAGSTSDTSRTYSLSMRMPMGSAVKYRYERQTASNTVAEHVSDGRPVRYRLYHVDGPGVVDDVVSRWTDTEFSGPTGRIKGQITDQVTGKPIPNLLVTAGGEQVLTTSDGSFLLEGLPPGIHNLVAFALDGSYHTFQQGARVAAESMTPTPIQMAAATPVKVVFVVKLPANTPPIIPVRLAGSLNQLGNTFADLTGGSNTLAVNMPELSTLPDGRYTLTLSLPAGADVRYKYTLGDGFWNGELVNNGDFRLRQLVVPEKNVLIEDTVDTWQTPGLAPITFDVNVPANTPTGDTVSIQLKPLYGWTEPVPMWKLEDNRYAYILYNPLNLPGQLSYRYCRNGQCGSADAADTPGAQNAGHPVEISDKPQTIKDQVSAWAMWGAPLTATSSPTTEVKTHNMAFLAGVEQQSAFHPSWTSLLPETLTGVQGLGANWLVLSPTWSFTRNAPPVLGQVTGVDALWPDLVQAADQARARSLNIAFYPQPNFPTQSADWWMEAPRDDSWWTVWFDQYRTFALHHADLAARSGASALILGGDWLAPALPGGILADGSPSGVPVDAEKRWRDLLTEVRSHYQGTLMWAIPYRDIKNAPVFLDAVDEIYLMWSEAVEKQADVSQADLLTTVGSMLDEVVHPFQQKLAKPLVLAVAYPSATGAGKGCVSDSQGGCINWDLLAPQSPDNPQVQLSLEEQSTLYQVMLDSTNSRDWISGFVTRGYYPPAALQDKSISLNGKPASNVLAAWFRSWLGIPPP